MSFFLYLTGLLIGIAAFLYMLSIYDKAKESLSSRKEPSEKNHNGIEVDSGLISFNKRPALPPGTRVCPLCGSSLTRYEGLYASKVFRGESATLMIMGCKYCYKVNGNISLT